MGKKHSVAGRVDGSLYEKIQCLSNEKDLTQSQVIEHLIAQALDEDELVIEQRTGVENGIDSLKNSINGGSGISKKIDELSEKLNGLTSESVKEKKDEDKIIIDESRLKRDSNTPLFQDYPELMEYASDSEILSNLEVKVDWFRIVGEVIGNEERDEDLALIKDVKFSQEEFEGIISLFFEKKFGLSVDSWSEARSTLLDEGYNMIGVNSYDSGYFVGFYKSVVKEWGKMEGVLNEDR